MADAAGDGKVKPVLTVPKTREPLGIALNLLCQCSINGTAAHLFTGTFTAYFKPTVRTYCSVKKIFKLLLLINNAPGHPQGLKEMYNETCIAFISAKGQGVILTFRSYYFRNTFRKALAATDSEWLVWRSRASTLKTVWEGFATLDAIKDICASWKEVRIWTLTGAPKSGFQPQWRTLMGLGLQWGQWLLTWQ